MTDESKTHIFLSLFFKNISDLKIQFNAELWSFHPNLLFCKNLMEISRIQKKNEYKSTWCKERGQCRNIVSADFQCRDIVWGKS